MDIVFKRQSTLSGILGILIILGSFVLLVIPGSAFPMNVIFAGMTALFGIAMVSLGFRKVPDYDSLLSVLSKYTHDTVDWKLKKFKENLDGQSDTGQQDRASQDKLNLSQ